jgi:hypothetical protein
MMGFGDSSRRPELHSIECIDTTVVSRSRLGNKITFRSFSYHFLQKPFLIRMFDDSKPRNGSAKVPFLVAIVDPRHARYRP